MDCSSKHLDGFLFIGGCILLSSFLVNKESISAIGFICSAVIIIPSVVLKFYHLFTEKNLESFLSSEADLYWIGFFLITAALLFNDGYIALSIILLCFSVVCLFVSFVFKSGKKF